MTPTLKRAKARVERAAMRWYRWAVKHDCMPIPSCAAAIEEWRALAALDKLTKGKK